MTGTRYWPGYVRQHVVTRRRQGWTTLCGIYAGPDLLYATPAVGMRVCLNCQRSADFPLDAWAVLRAPEYRDIAELLGESP